MILIFLFVLIIFFLSSCKENFYSQQEDENNYQYCLGQYSTLNCITDERCLQYGFNEKC
jgi:hypothetical protein